MKNFKEKLIAAILCLFVGQFGIHRFYTKHIKSGLVMLALGILFGPITIAWSIVDLFLILFGGLAENTKTGKTTMKTENSML